MERKEGLEVKRVKEDRLEVDKVRKSDGLKSDKNRKIKLILIFTFQLVPGIRAMRQANGIRSLPYS